MNDGIAARLYGLAQAMSYGSQPETPLASLTDHVGSHLLDSILTCNIGDHSPTVVPAECIEYFNSLFFINLWTSAICADTEAVGVPSGMRQKSAVHLAGVARSFRSVDMLMLTACARI